MLNDSQTKQKKNISKTIKSVAITKAQTKLATIKTKCSLGAIGKLKYRGIILGVKMYVP